MKSIVCHGPKDLRIEDTKIPRIGPGQIMVQVAAGGICGSDLHYFNQGGFGPIRIKEPLILGHEVAGYVTVIGDNVTGFSEGELVAINPSRPCKNCEYCDQAMYNQCLDMRYYGSAMRFPHVQGAFSETLVVEAWQCEKLPEGISPQQAAFAEPLAVALAAVGKAGSLMGKRVLVTGAGPIGALIVIVARLHGAVEVVATDIIDAPLATAVAVGADRTINVATHGDELKSYGQKKGAFDVVIEASGSAAAIHSALDVIRPQGVFVLLGIGGDVTLPLTRLVGKEILMRGSFRFHREFEWATRLIAKNSLPLDPLMTAVYPITDAVKAFETANDRHSSMKVQLVFN